MAKLRQVINLKVRIMSLVYTQSCLPRSGDQPKGTNPWGLVPRHKVCERREESIQKVAEMPGCAISKHTVLHHDHCALQEPRMSIFKHATDILGAKVNRLLSRAEDPAETLDLSYEKMLTSLQEGKRHPRLPDRAGI